MKNIIDCVTTNCKFNYILLVLIILEYNIQYKINEQDFEFFHALLNKIVLCENLIRNRYTTVLLQVIICIQN